MSKTYDQTINELKTGAPLTIDQLSELVESTSGTVPNTSKDTVFLLNSGLMPDGTTKSSALIAEIQTSSDAVGINQ